MKTLHLLFVGIICFGFITSCNGQNTKQDKSHSKKTTIDYTKLDTATFAGGCFWCVEASFEQIRGVAEAVSGYAGGKEKNPTYERVSQGKTDHAETVQVYYDPEIIGFETLLDIFFTAHDPTQLNRQGPDIGKQYRSVLFFHNEAQEKLTRDKMAELEEKGVFNKPLVTQVVPFTKFWPAEDYHQDYEKHHPNNPYIRSVSKPKIDKVAKKFSHILKEE